MTTKVRVPRKKVAVAETVDRKTKNLQHLIEAAEALKKVDIRSIPHDLRDVVKDVKDALPEIVQEQQDYIDGRVE